MAIHIKHDGRDSETRELQILDVNAVVQYCIASGSLESLVVEEGAYEESGEVFLYQVSSDDEEAPGLDDLYAGAKAIDTSMPSLEDLKEFDNLIATKAKYELVRDEKGRCSMKFLEVAALDLDEQLCFDEDGNLRKAAELEE